MNILIVDDDIEDSQILFEVVKEVLPRADCRMVQSAKSALEAVQSFTPNVVFVDAIMYPTGGKQVLLDLRRGCEGFPHSFRGSIESDTCGGC